MLVSMCIFMRKSRFLLIKWTIYDDIVLKQGKSNAIKSFQTEKAEKRCQVAVDPLAYWHVFHLQRFLFVCLRLCLL